MHDSTQPSPVLADDDATRPRPVIGPQAVPPAPPQDQQPEPEPEPGPQPAPPKGEAKNDMLAWAALIGGFIMWPLGILFGHVSNRAAKRANRRRSMLAIVGLMLSYLGMSIVSVFVIAGIAGSHSTPVAAVEPAPPASSAPAAPATPAQPATASGYLTAHGWTPVKHWSYDQWQKENKGAAAYDPFIAKGADVVAAGSKGSSMSDMQVEFAVKVTPDSIGRISEAGGLAEIIAGINAKGAHARIDGSYLVADMAAPSSGDAGSAASDPGSAASAETPAAETPATPAGTVSQQQALESAKSYLDMGTGFSRAGLIDQLSSQYGEQFSVADATWAVAHSGADWNAQAVMSAKGYMKMGGFSRAGLIDQLTSPSGEQFTMAQATYAVNQVGL
jgi:hypothetical protein